MKSRRGFSLIELALVLGISGLMIGFMLQSQQSSGTSDCYVAAKLQLRDVDGAIQRFARKNERLPMPAARTVGVESPTYGREASGGAIDSAGGTSWGALPFQALELSPSYASDCWGNKLTYVVTTALTTSATSGGYLDHTVLGNISVKKDDTTTITSVAGYAVVSHGEDALGAVKANYSSGAKGWCTGGTTLATQNCLASSATIASAVFNNGKDAGAAYFDDLVIIGGRMLSVNGQCNNAVALGCAAGSAANDGGQTACNSTRTWHCVGANGGTDDITCSRANGACVSCAATSLTWGAGCSATFPLTAHGGTTPVTANTNPAYTVGSTATATCTSGVFSAPVGSCTAVPAPINGACNNTVALGCSAGTASTDNGLTACGTTRTWHCDGANGGSNATTCNIANAACASCPAASLSWSVSCTANFPLAAHGATTAAQTNTNPGYSGTATATCANGVFTASGACNPLVPVNGACDASAPGGACAAGSASGDNGLTACGTTRSWSCDGANGGTNAACTFANAACGGGCTLTYIGAFISGIWDSTAYGGRPCTLGQRYWVGPPGNATATFDCTCPAVINGACNNAVALGCSAGTASTDNGLTGCGTTRTWHCDGSGGGTNDTTCSLANASCGPCTWQYASNQCEPYGTFGPSDFCPGRDPNVHGECWVEIGGPGCGGSDVMIERYIPNCPAVPVNGACNNAAPLGCTAGTAISDNGQTSCGTTRQWVCQGSGGGTNSGTCSLANAACGPVVNGVCNNAAPLGCTTGTAISDNGQTSCGTTRQWVCQGSGGGSNSGTCSYANAACAPSCAGDEGYCDNGTCYIQCNGVCDTCPNNFGFPIANNFGAGCDGSLCPAPAVPEDGECEVGGVVACRRGTFNQTGAGCVGGPNFATAWDCEGINGGATVPCYESHWDPGCS